MQHNLVKIIQHRDIVELNISAKACIDWIESSFCMKPYAQLPAKISLHPQGDDFFNTMPCILPESFGRFCIKEVHRIAEQVPALGSDILLYNSITGHLLALMDGDWITTMRTGAVTALAARLFKKKDANTYSFIGLGNTARAAGLCIIADNKDKPLKFQLLRYKDQTESFIHRFQHYNNVQFEIFDNVEDMISSSEIIISCITSAKGLICPTNELFPKGILVIPVHTRGFQNCDLFFDKVFGDDAEHLHGFRYFDKFRYFDELSNVLIGNSIGRENDNERILSYNIGLGLHDAVYASNIYDLLSNHDVQCSFQQQKEDKKFWI